MDGNHAGYCWVHGKNPRNDDVTLVTSHSGTEAHVSYSNISSTRSAPTWFRFFTRMAYKHDDRGVAHDDWSSIIEFNKLLILEWRKDDIERKQYWSAVRNGGVPESWESLNKYKSTLTKKTLFLVPQSRAQSRAPLRAPSCVSDRSIRLRSASIGSDSSVRSTAGPSAPVSSGKRPKGTYGKLLEAVTTVHRKPHNKFQKAERPSKEDSSLTPGLKTLSHQALYYLECFDETKKETYKKDAGVAVSATLNLESDNMERLCGKEFVEKAKAKRTLKVKDSTKLLRDCYLEQLESGLPHLISALPDIRTKWRETPNMTNVLDALEMITPTVWSRRGFRGRYGRLCEVCL